MTATIYWIFAGIGPSGHCLFAPTIVTDSSGWQSGQTSSPKIAGGISMKSILVQSFPQVGQLVVIEALCVSGLMGQDIACNSRQ